LNREKNARCIPRNTASSSEPGAGGCSAAYQNEPIVEAEGEEMLSAEQVAAKTNGYERGVIPLAGDCTPRVAAREV
jgi:hypothetical protein